jgi:anti-sigma regulatory factor (Ser/Thr protein kinase)
MKNKVFPADIEYLHEMLEFIQTYCREKNFQVDAINKIMLATEEAIVNVIYHGYKHKTGSIEITCEETSNKPGVKIVIKDKGVPFNPMEKADLVKKHHHKPAEDDSVGGYGIFLYVEIMDAVEYQRDQDVNLLYLIKYL